MHIIYVDNLAGLLDVIKPRRLHTLTSTHLLASTAHPILPVLLLYGLHWKVVITLFSRYVNKTHLNLTEYK